ncbi:hypothetical protein [Streptomyces sp. SJL17-4]|uniref:hypothetical protein n=1 Tax=Streptomyces sp. SJL17-4 TaxID=2967224 RepID=UPI0030D41757
MRHHDRSERTTQAPSRRHQTDPMGRRPEPMAGRPDATADRSDTWAGQDRSGSARPASGTAGGDAERPPPEHSPAVAPTAPRHAQPGTADARDDQPRPADAWDDQPRPADARDDQPRPADARNAQPQPSDPGQVPPPQVPSQRTTSAHPPAPPVAPQTPPMPVEPPGHGGPPRHAAPAPQDPRQNAHGAGAVAGGAGEHGPDHARSARPAGEADAEEIPDLLGPAGEAEFRRRWHEVQGRFVDDPRQAVHAADVLVGDVMRALADTFALHRHALEGQWSQGLEADTESLRRALCQYRALFHRLLST